MSTAQPFPLTALGSMADKQPVACVAGTVTKIWPRRSGSNSNGDWSIQNLMIKGTCGTEIGIQLKDREEFGKENGNRFIILEAKVGDKGMSGLYIFDDEYQGKTTRKLKATPTAQISWGGEPTKQQPAQSGNTQPPHDPDWPEVQQNYSPADEHAPARKQPDNHANEAMREAKRTIVQIVNLHLLVAKAVEKQEAPNFKKATGMDMTEAQRQGAIGSVFIEACKQGLVRSMPTSPME